MKTLPVKAFKLSGIALSVACLMFSCAQSREEKSYEAASDHAMADSVAGNNLVVSNAPAIMTKDTAHAFIRKADVRFKVKDVKQSTFRIEDMVRSHGGFVTYTNLQSQVSRRNSTRISEDSVREETYYEVENNFTIRVPNDMLDTTLKDIATQMDFLDHRKITANDVKLELLANRLTAQRIQKHNTRMENEIDHQGKKLPQTTNAEDGLLMHQENADQSRIRNMQLMDEVHYSTMTLCIYQDETQRIENHAYMAPAKPYEPGFGSKVWTAVQDGADFMGNIIVFFLRIWPALLLIVVLFILIRWLLKQKWANS